MKTEKIAVYEPDSFIKRGFFADYGEMTLSLFRSRELILRLFLRDFNAKYRQSLLGVLWVILNPLITVSIFIFLNRSGILNIGSTPVPYAVFASIGISLYGIFSTGISTTSGSVIGAGPMVIKINFPKISLVIAAMGQVIVEFIVRMILVIALMIVYGVVPHWASVFLPFMLFPFILLTLGIGLILALLVGVFRDLIYVISFFTMILLFLVPALYPPPQTGILVIANRWNPLSHLIVGCRDVLISGILSNPSEFLWASGFSAVLFLVSWRIFFISESKIAERI